MDLPVCSHTLGVQPEEHFFTKITKKKKSQTKEHTVTAHSHTHTFSHDDGDTTRADTAPQVIDERAQVSVRHRACIGERAAGPTTHTHTHAQSMA